MLATEKSETIEAPTPEDEDLDRYLDGPGQQPETIQLPVDTEDEVEAAENKRTFFEKPTTKVGAVVLATVIVLGGLGMAMSSKVAESTPEKKDKKDQRIAELERRIENSAEETEAQTAERQAAEYARHNPNGGKKSGAKAKVKVNKTLPVVANQNMSRSYPLATIPRSYMPQGISQPRAVSLPRASQSAPQENSQVTALRKKIDEMAARMAQMQQASENSAIAQVPEDVPVAQNVSDVQDQPVQLAGGIEEQAIMSDASIAQIPVGSEARAVLDTPIVGAGGPVLLTLKTNVSDGAGKVCMAAGTKLVGQAQLVGGVAQIQLTAAMVGGQQVPIPAQSVAVFRSDKSPLMAKRLNGGGNGLGKALLGSLLDGGGAIAGQLLQPRTTTQFSANGFSSASSENSGATMGNALLAGGGAVSKSLGSNVKQQIQRTDGSAQVMGVKAGQELSLVFSGPVQLLTASAAMPPEPEVQAQSQPQSQPQPVSYNEEEQAIMDAPDSGEFIEQPEN